MAATIFAYATAGGIADSSDSVIGCIKRLRKFLRQKQSNDVTSPAFWYHNQLSLDTTPLFVGLFHSIFFSE